MLGQKNPLRKGRSPLELVLISGGLLLLITFVIYNFPSTSYVPRAITPNTPAAVVQQFYEYERSGDFGSSWELFHSNMKQRFNKQAYIQQRAKVFMQDFGVDTFDFSVGSAQTVRSWKMSPDSVPLTDAYRVPITQTFKTTFGIFTLQQDVYVADDNGKLRVLWAY